MSVDKQKLSEKEFVTQIREALDASVERIDAETRHKINAARKQALAQQKQNTFFASHWGKAGIATALSIFIAILIVKTQLPGPIEEEGIEAMELMAAQDTFDMYEELEFYTWLAEEDVTT